MRIRRGSSGLWGTDNNMPAHPSISVNDARIIADYILNINNRSINTLPVKGKFVTKVPKDDNGRGTYIVRAAYTDRGVDVIPPQTTDTVLILRSPKLNPLKADAIEGGALRDQLDEYVFLTAKHDAYIVYKSVDMTDVRQILFRANWHLYDIYPGGKIEIRIGRRDGELIGETVLEPEQFNTRYRGVFDGLPNPTPDQQKKMKKYPPINISEFFAPGVDKNSFTIPSVATVKSVQGIQDVYFVFKSTNTRKDESLFPLAEIVMMNTVSEK
jgi:cytochrome c